MNKRLHQLVIPADQSTLNIRLRLTVMPWYDGKSANVQLWKEQAQGIWYAMPDRNIYGCSIESARQIWRHVARCGNEGWFLATA